MLGSLPVFVFALAWILTLTGVTAPGTDAATPFDEEALRWMLFLGAGWSVAGGVVVHTIFAKPTAKAIGWTTNGFQYEVGFASLGIGLGAIYASTVDVPQAWIAASIAAGTFLTLAGVNHVIEIFREHNYAPGNTFILISDFGIPISLLVLLFSTGAL